MVGFQSASVLVAPERVRAETPLGPYLLQTEGFLVDLLAERLQRPLSVRVLRHEMERVGLVRDGLISAGGIPLYRAITVVRRLPETRRLIRILRANPAMFFGEGLKREKLFHHKTAPEIRRVPFLPECRSLFGADENVTAIWERTYAVVSPKAKRIAGVTERFSPKLEALLGEGPAVRPSGA